MRSLEFPTVINAWGTPTPFGVSRSSKRVTQAVGGALQRHVDMSRLQAAVSVQVARLSGTESACFCHCASAAITLAVAGTLTGCDSKLVAGLPRAFESGVVAIQSEHCIDYGQSIVQAIRLTGAQVSVLEGAAEERKNELASLLDRNVLRAVVFVESILVLGEPALSRSELARFLKGRRARLIVDAAAQDWRMTDRPAMAEADITIFSAQKYLAAPTCGVLVGRDESVRAASANLAGIGRGMKATKEGVSGLSEAIAERDWKALPELSASNLQRATRFAEKFGAVSEFSSSVTRDSAYGPFPRVLLDYRTQENAELVAAHLFANVLPVVVGQSRLDSGLVTIELSHVTREEEAEILARLRAAEASLKDNRPNGVIDQACGSTHKDCGVWEFEQPKGKTIAVTAAGVASLAGELAHRFAEQTDRPVD